MMALSVNTRQSTFTVSEPCEIRIELRSDQELVPGDTVECQFPNAWSVLTGPSFTRNVQAKDPAGAHYVDIASATATFRVDVRPRNYQFHAGPSRHGRLITGTVVSGSVRAGDIVTLRYANTMAPYIVDAGTVWLRVKGEGPVTAPVLTTCGGPAVATRVLAPSSAVPGRPFEVLIVTLDRFDNASSSTLEPADLTLQTGEVVARGVRVAGSVRVAVTIKEPGIHRLVFGGTVSNAVRVSEAVSGPYWGDVHFHTGLSHDGQGGNPYDYARNVSGLDFAGVTDHCEGLGDAGYEQLLRWAADADKPGTFVPVYADERNPRRATGHHNIYFRTLAALAKYRVYYGSAADESVRRACCAMGSVAGLGENALAPAVLMSRGNGLDASEWNVVEEGYLDRLPADDVMLVPHHTGIAWGRMSSQDKGAAIDYEALGDLACRPVMEIYSHHGQSEVGCPQHILSYEFNRMRNPEQRANVSYPGPHYAQDWLMAGRRLGFIASSDEHTGQGGRRHGGVAAVFAGDLSRDGIFNAVRARRCYATTGERILVEFTIDGIPMGQEAVRPKGARLAISLNVWGTDRLLRVEILKYRFGVDTAFRQILSEIPQPASLDAAYSCEDVFETDAVYYARVTQAPLEWPGMAWTSPIWITLRTP